MTATDSTICVKMETHRVLSYESGDTTYSALNRLFVVVERRMGTLQGACKLNNQHLGRNIKPGGLSLPSPSPNQACFHEVEIGTILTSWKQR